jgi:hypothetical protein
MAAYPATERIARFVAETTLDSVPRQLIKELTERVDYKGTVLVPLDIEEARRVLDRSKMRLTVKPLQATCMAPDSPVARMSPLGRYREAI